MKLRNRSILQIICLLVFFPMASMAQVGEYRNDLAIGFNGGYMLSNVGFTPKVTQTFHGGLTGGLSFRYVCEKYFNSICSIYAEFNYAQMGWKEDILDREDQPVINEETQIKEEFSRTLNYVQLPIFARLGWGKEQRGFQFFFQAGPQVGYYLGDKVTKNFDLDKRNWAKRANDEVHQDTMAVENKLDYGIAAGIGMEYSLPKAGHLMLDLRYYYGLGNIYKDTKRDYFGKSNNSSIILKLTYLFDLKKTKQ
ncbi:MAG: PorT family protein [Prevotella sp.]|nr:PorT family protein [Prevotella sp.]